MRMLSISLRSHLVVRFWWSLSLILLLARTNGSSVQAAAAVTLPTPATIIPPALAAGDEFGYAVAMDGDFLVVGALRTTVNGQENQGAAYLFRRDGADPTQFVLVKQLTASDDENPTHFGAAVAIDGDTVVVGATHADPDDHFDIGAAYVFERNHGGADAWGQTATLWDRNFNDDFSEHGYLGEAVAIHGDTIVVGAPRQRGRAFIFGRNQGGTGQWGEVQSFGAPNGWENGEFGKSLAFDGQLLVIGGSRASMVPGASNANAEGAVFLYQHDGSQWANVAKLAVADEDPETPYGNNSAFGRAVALSGDIIYVGAPFMTVNDLHNVGEVYAFQHNSSLGQWEPTATLIASDGGEFDYFGRALYPAGDGLFVSSDHGPNDTVYFFRNTSLQNNVSAQANAAPQSWQEVYSFSVADEAAVGSNFGESIAGSGNTFAIGASGYESNRGALYTYPLDAMLAVQPDDDPDDDPDAPIATTVFLPIVARGQPLPTFQPTGTLANRGVLNGPDGVKLGALAASLPEPLDVTIAATVAPPDVLPFGITPRGGYYYLGAERNILTTMQEPLLVGFPVPPGVDTAHLALGVYNTVDLHSGNGERVWDFLDGLYDAEQNLFLTALPFLSANGDTFVLAEHPDFDSPANGSRLESAVTPVGVFSVSCHYFNPSECGTAVEGEVAADLDMIYNRMTNGFGFTDLPRLTNIIGEIILEPDNTSLAGTLRNFTAVIVPPTYFRCERAAGLYRPQTGRLYLCYDPATGLTSFKVQTLIHEYFHAVEFAFPKVYDPGAVIHEPREDWIIEGMAMLAENSYFLDGDVARNENGGYETLHTVDTSLIAGVSSDSNYEEYFAQDFWAYVGQRFQRGLGYLEPILENGGATTDGVADALEAEFSVPFHELYWGWVKNQVIENVYNLGDDTGQRCSLTNEAVTKGVSPVTWNYHPDESAKYPPDEAWESVDPWHATVVEIKFPARMIGAFVVVGLEECQNTVGDDNIVCHVEKEKLLHSKVYVQGEADCEADKDDIYLVEGWRHLTELSRSKRYFVVVANADPNGPHRFVIGIEPQFPSQ